MPKTILASAVVVLGLTGPVMAQESIRISSAWGEVTATLADNEAARSLARMLPLTIEMSDHLRQEKTGNLPSALPELTRQRDFSVGTLGLWSADHFVIYYRSGRVPSPGIIILGQVRCLGLRPPRTCHRNARGYGLSDACKPNRLRIFAVNICSIF